MLARFLASRYASFKPATVHCLIRQYVIVGAVRTMFSYRSLFSRGRVG